MCKTNCDRLFFFSPYQRKKMGSQNYMSNDHSRTNWTQAMECYFIDLMLDQVHLGNRMGHTFQKQAWNDMLIMFNATFGSPYDVNILKSRYSNMWKQFNDIRNLLDQNEFSWDNARQMVIADKSVWDAHIKAHPDVQSYRNRTLMNYDDLRLIYAHTTADGRYSLSSHDIDYDEDIQGISAGLGGNTIPADKNGSKTDWTPAMDHYFVKLMVDQLKKGNKINNTFTKQAWNEMITLFNEEFSCQHSRSFLKHHYKKLLKYYTDMKSLLEVKGFYWDEKEQMIVADDDVWDNYTKGYPSAYAYRQRTSLSIRDLSLIYENTISNGLLGHMQHQKDFEDNILEGFVGGKREEHSSASNGYLSCKADLDNEEGENIQYHANGNCSTTHWTPPMDRYFIDLMLEKLREVKPIDYTFSSRAWLDMIVLFKDRFGSQHDRGFFRTHYRSLKKHYYDLENILKQRGFQWHDMENVVTAHHSTWDAYIKEHPHAKSYRNCRTPNYNDLSLIYGNLASDGGKNQLGQELTCNGNGSRFNSSYHWRSDWTPPMERYFIDLMLEQVRIGNMVDKKFSKQAWNDMVSNFSSEFGYQYDKDVLKSQFVNLKKRFNDMKTLLDQSGFVWDEIQQMILADEGLWDAHVQDYPDARSYHNRALPNFNDLFFIYGNDNNMKSQYHPSNSFNAADNELDGGDQEYQPPVGSDLPEIRWTKRMDRCFIDFMLEQVHRGNKNEGEFNKQAWTWIMTSFNKKYGFVCDRNVLENQYIRLMKEYEDIRSILDQKSFAWDEIQQVVTADDDVWEAYIEEHPDAILYKNRNLDYFEDLCLIYGNDNLATRKECKHDVLKYGKVEICYSRKKRKPFNSSTSSSTRKFPRTTEEVQLQVPISENPSLGKKLVNCAESKQKCSIESIVAALQTVPHMNDELFLEACEVLEDERKAKMFVAMDVTARRQWLLRKLRQ